MPLLSKPQNAFTFAVVLVSTVLAVVVCVLSTSFVSASIGWRDCNISFVSNTDYPHEQTRNARLCHGSNLAISYDNVMVNPAWSAYYITHEDAENIIPGRDSFREDPDLKTLGITQGAVDNPAYGRSNGYDNDKGHLCPSEIHSYSATGKWDTYFMSNVAAQNSKFNEQQWRDLESHVVKYLQQNMTGDDGLYIITGLAYNDRSNPNMINGIAKPDYYFKVICDAKRGKSAGFYGQNIDTARYPAQYFETVKAVETLYGGSLFPSTTCNTGTVNPGDWWGY